MTSFKEDNGFLNALVAEVESTKKNVPKWTVLGETWIRDEARKRLGKAHCVADPEWYNRNDSAHMHLCRESRHDFDFETFIPASVMGKVT